MGALGLVAGAVLATGALAGPEQIRALEQQGRDAEALALADRLVQEQPGWELPRIEAARLRLRQGADPHRVEVDLEVAQALAPENPRAHFLFGLLREEQGQDGQAVLAYRVALAYRADYDEARLRLAGLLHALARWPEAEAEYRELARRDPGAAQPRLQLADVLERQGALEGAERELRALWEGKPPSPAAGRRLLALYERTDQPEKARRLRAALDGPPKKQMRPLKPSRR